MDDFHTQVTTEASNVTQSGQWLIKVRCPPIWSISLSPASGVTEADNYRLRHVGVDCVYYNLFQINLNSSMSGGGLN